VLNKLSITSNKKIKMNKIKLLILCFFVFLNIGCKSNEDTQKFSIEKTIEINDYLKTESSNTLGLAVAAIKNGTVLYESYLGKENTANKLVNKKTIFPLYSLSKLVTSTAVFQLIEENKIHLDDNISLYIKNLPKEWKTIQIKHLLTHSSGLPDYNLMKGKVSDSITLVNLFNDQLHFKVGERWEYNQTNFWFLTKIIENITNQSFESYVIENQFPESNLLFSSNFIDTIPNRSFKYNFDNNSKKWEKVNLDFGKRANSAGGMNLTLNQFIKWSKKFDNNDFIQPITKNKMWTSFNYETSFYFENEKDKFLYGWQQYYTNNEISYGFSGGLVTGYRKFVNQNMTIIVLTNGLKNAPIRNKIINKIAGIVDENLAVEQN
jgi:CubicO group peptidase (beta-lactamase class C family)